MVVCCLRCALKPSASATSAMSTLYQHCRGHGSPYGLQDTLSTLRPFCSLQASLRLRHGRKTRYGWVASPYPTGTCTLLETPSLSWRDNAAPQPRLEAPGSQGMLPYPSPLRTVHESLPSHGSSPCCLLSMSLVVRMMTPPMHQHAVFLTVVTTLVCGGDVVIVNRIAVVERHLTEPAPKGLGL